METQSQTPKPDLNVQHKLKGPLVEQIRNLCYGLFDTKNFDILARSHPQDPTKWQCVASSKSTLYLGTVDVTSDPSETILKGLLSLLGVFLKVYRERHERMTEAMHLNARLQTDATWSFDES